MFKMEEYKIGGISALLGWGSNQATSKEEKKAVTANLFDKAIEEASTKITFSRKRPPKSNKAQVKNEVEESEGSGEDLDSPDEESSQALPSPRKKQKLSYKDDERLGRTLFVGNVPLSINRKKLTKFFSKYGKVETVRTRSIPVGNLKLPRKACAAKKLYHEDRATMNSYVVFEDEESARNAVESNGDVLDGYHIRVDLAGDDKKHNNSESVFVGNIPFMAEAEELRNHFCQCGDIADVRIIRDKATGLGKGFGYLRFKSRDGVTLALKMNESEFKGRALRVSRSVDPSKIKKHQEKHTRKRARGRNSHGKVKSNREAFQKRIENKNKSKNKFKPKNLSNKSKISKKRRK